MNVTGLDWSTLTLRDAMDLATLIEEEARDRYAELAHQMKTHHTQEAAEFFEKMRTIEELHRAVLLERRQGRFGAEPMRVTRSMLYDVEAPSYDEVRVFMTRRQALQTAMTSEVKAHEFFVEACKHVKDPEVLVLFKELAEEEVEHQEYVKKEIDKLPPDDPYTLDDSSDPPVPQ